MSFHHDLRCSWCFEGYQSIWCVINIKINSSPKSRMFYRLFYHFDARTTHQTIFTAGRKRFQRKKPEFILNYVNRIKPRQLLTSLANPRKVPTSCRSSFCTYFFPPRRYEVSLFRSEVGLEFFLIRNNLNDQIKRIQVNALTAQF